MADTHDFTVRVKVTDQAGIDAWNDRVDQGLETGIFDEDVSEWDFNNIAQAAAEELAEVEVVGYETGPDA